MGAPATGGPADWPAQGFTNQGDGTWRRDNGDGTEDVIQTTTETANNDYVSDPDFEFDSTTGAWIRDDGNGGTTEIWPARAATVDPTDPGSGFTPNGDGSFDSADGDTRITPG